MANVIADRDPRILNAAVDLAKDDHYNWLTRDAVAKAAGVSPATVSNAFGGMKELKRAVLREAVARPVVEIVAQGLADRHPIVLDAPDELKKRAAQQLTAA